MTTGYWIATVIWCVQAWALGVLAGWILWGRNRSSWIEPTTHDIGILPGGQVIHHSVCWCKQQTTT